MQYGQQQQPQYQQHHYPRTFRADASGSGQQQQQQQLASQSHSQRRHNGGDEDDDVEGVRPDSLALKSPLEQLSRSLSYTRNAAGSRHGGGAGPAGSSRRPRGAQAQDGQAAGDAREVVDGSSQQQQHHRRPPPLGIQTDVSPSFLDLDSNSPTLEPVRFSPQRAHRGAQGQERGQGQGSESSDNDASDTSDTRSQLINAFRNSTMTRTDGGRRDGTRDSSYSWAPSTGTEADPDSPNITLDFKQAQAVFDAANHRGSVLMPDGRERQIEAGAEQEQQQGRERGAQAGSAHAGAAEASSAAYPTDWDADEAQRSRARASSWDKQEAHRMGLHRVPSHRSTSGNSSTANFAGGARQATVSGGPAAGPSGSSGSTARRARGATNDSGTQRSAVESVGLDAEGRSRSASSSNPGPGQERQSAVSAFDPFQYASYESAENSEDHSRMEELQTVPGSGALPSSAGSLGGSATASFLDQQYLSAGNAYPDQHYGSGSQQSDGDEPRPDSVYMYPLTPPMPETEDGRFSDGDTPTGTVAAEASQGAHRVRSQAPAGATSRSYHSRFTKLQQKPKEPQSPSKAPPETDTGQDARHRYQSSVYPDSPEPDQLFDFRQAGMDAGQPAYLPNLPSFPPNTRDSGTGGSASDVAAQHRQPQAQLGAAFNPSASYSHPQRPPRPPSPDWPDPQATPRSQISQNVNQLRSVSSPESQQQPYYTHAAADGQGPFSSVIPQGSPTLSPNASGSGSARPIFKTAASSSSSSMNPSASASSGLGVDTSSGPGVKRSPSNVLASAIAKHRVAREAAGLPTDGEYYVDPKSGKHYFVAHSGAKGDGGRAGAAGKENERGALGVSQDSSTGSASAGGKQQSSKGAGRSKLRKKEAGWEVSKVNPAALAAATAAHHQQQQQQQQQQQRSLSSSNTTPRPLASPSQSGSAAGSEDGRSGSGKKWKAWGSSLGSRPKERGGTPDSSPVQRGSSSDAHGGRHDAAASALEGEYAFDQGGRAPIAFDAVHGTPRSFGGQNGRLNQGVFDSPGSNSAYGGLGNGSPSPNIRQIPRLETTQLHGSPSGSASGPAETLLLSPVGPSGFLQGQRPGMHDRAGSVYSNYSYYGENLPSESGHGHSQPGSRAMSRAGTTSPGPSHALGYFGQLGGPPSNFQSSPGGAGMPMASPYIAPTAPQFQPGAPNIAHVSAVDDSTGAGAGAGAGGTHSRQPSTTLDKMKASVHRSGSLQLLAQSKHANLTVPKAAHGAGAGASKQQDAVDLSRLDPSDPLACLHLGIDAHERGELEKSAEYFQRSAEGGCGLGMLMYGLTLRHGWGCESDPEKGFRFLQSAAGSVVQDLDRVISGQIQLSEQEFKEQAAKSELVLSIYELGQCFLRGWGVSKDKKVALSYFELAANLGDPDAQSELGFCYSTGRGCKKDLKKAARYYRLAAGQGMISYGMQWIYKEKYDD